MNLKHRNPLFPTHWKDQDVNLMNENAAKERPSWSDGNDGSASRAPAVPLERTFA